jgi:hypothetical protein
MPEINHERAPDFSTIKVEKVPYDHYGVGVYVLVIML